MVHAEWISAARDWRWEGDVEDGEKRGRREIVGMDVKVDFSGGVGGWFWGIGDGFLEEDWGGGRGEEEEEGGGGGGMGWVSSVMAMIDK